MNFLTLFARNLRRGPYTEAFPFGPADAGAQAPARPHRIRRQDLRGLPAVREAVPVGRDPLRPHARAASPSTAFIRPASSAAPARSIARPARSVRPTDWSLAHLEGETFALAEHGLIPPIVCVECGGKGLDTAPNVAKVRPPLSDEEHAALARALPEVPQQVSQEPGEDAMTRLPEDIQARLAAAAPRRDRLFRRRPRRTASSPHGAAWRTARIFSRSARRCSSSARGWRWSRRCSRRRPKRKRKRNPKRARAKRPSRRRKRPRPSAARRSTASPMSSTTTSCSAATS